MTTTSARRAITLALALTVSAGVLTAHNAHAARVPDPVTFAPAQVEVHDARIPTHLPFAYCLAEDASAENDMPACRWDAASLGNGEGMSFTVYALGEGARVFAYDNGAREFEYWDDVDGIDQWVSVPPGYTWTGDYFDAPEPSQAASDSEWEAFCGQWDQGVYVEDGARFCDG